MTKPDCADCAGVPVNHFTERWSSIFDLGITRLLSPLFWLKYLLAGWASYLHLDRLAILVIKLLGKANIVHFSDNPESYDNSRTRVLWKAANEKGIKLKKLQLFGYPTQFFLAQYKTNPRIFVTLPRPYGPATQGFDWMDNKAVMKAEFQKAGIPVARGGSARTYKQALAIFNQIQKPAIAKPIHGSRSRHTTLHINTSAELAVAYGKAKQLCFWVIIEEELSGLVYRPTVIGGKVIAVARKEPGFVMGDGMATIAELVDRENQNPLRQGPIFHHLPQDSLAEAELTRQGHSWTSVPLLGTKVYLSQKTGRDSGGSIVDVTEETHPDNIAIFEKVAHVVGDPLIGIDFVIGNIARPWHEQKLCGVLECNSLPFIDVHHATLGGPARDVAGALWDIVFPELQTK
jgi:D-alanine-D-alanine ligase-like ATP-grasp enzyme